MKIRGRQRRAVAAAFVSLCFAGTAWAASHSDAPLIKQDPQANLTDVYAFVGSRYDDPSAKVLNVIVHLRPFSEPGDGVMYERFAEDVRHSIHIANPKTGGTAIRYDFVFSSVNPPFAPRLRNPNTILSYGRGTEIGPIQNVGRCAPELHPDVLGHQSRQRQVHQPRPRPA